MTEFEITSTEIYLFIGIFAILFFSLLLYGFILFLKDFSQELKYLNNEIRRTRGSERKYWKKRRRKLWLSILPFIRY